jgi:hypothetical protein
LLSFYIQFAPEPAFLQAFLEAAADVPGFAVHFICVVQEGSAWGNLGDEVMVGGLADSLFLSSSCLHCTLSGSLAAAESYCCLGGGVFRKRSDRFMAGFCIHKMYSPGTAN